MRIIFWIWNKFLVSSKLLSICVLLLLCIGCEDLHLGLPGNATTQAQQALDSQKKCLTKLTGSSKKELIKNKSEVQSLLNKAEPFLARKANELQIQELILTQDHLKKSQEALRTYLEERTKPGKDTTTSEMTRALNQASESINSAEDTLNQFKNKQDEKQ